jgi:hypothetical protein
MLYILHYVIENKNLLSRISSCANTVHKDQSSFVFKKYHSKDDIFNQRYM